MAKSERAEFRKSLMQLIGSRPVVYSPEIARRVGGAKAGILLSQLLYWHDDPTVINRGGWILKSVADLEHETALSQLEQQTARDVLINTGVIEAVLKGVPRIWHYRVITDRLTEILIDPQTHSMDNPLNGKPNQCSRGLRINIERDSRGMFTRKTDQLNNVLKITDSRLHKRLPSSSSTDKNGLSTGAKSEEEEGFFSTELLASLQEIGVYADLIPEIAQSGIEEADLFQMIEQARNREPDPGKTAALFVYRVRQARKNPTKNDHSSGDRDRANRKKYTLSLERWGISNQDE